MTPTRLLHMLLLLTLVVFLIVMLKTMGPQENGPRFLPQPDAAALRLASLPGKKVSQAPLAVPGRFVFPTPMDRRYAAMPVVWERDRVELMLAEGDINTPPAPEKPPRARLISAAPTVVKLPWVFTLP